MSPQTVSAAPIRNAEFTISRVFDAPRELVFKAWTDPKHLARWWGPNDFTNPVCEVDLRPGGALLVVMRSADGNENPMRGVFHEVVEPERLVMSISAFEDELGVPQLETTRTITFAEEGGKTTLTMQEVFVKVWFDVAEERSGMQAGWGESFDRLDAHLAQA